MQLSDRRPHFVESIGNFSIWQIERIDRIDSTFTGSPSSLMRCNCPIDDRTCRIDSKLFHLTNRTNRSNRQHFVHFSLIKWNFSDRQQIERCFVGWTLCDSIGHEWPLEFGRNFSAIVFSRTSLWSRCRRQQRSFWPAMTWMLTRPPVHYRCLQRRTSDWPHLSFK